MRKVISWISILIGFSLVACSFSPGGQQRAPGTTPTKSGDQMQTEIAQLLTMMPTTTGQPVVEATKAPDLPTVAVQTETPSVATPEVQVLSPTAPPAPTDTPQPVAQATTEGKVLTATLVVATATTGPTATKGAGTAATASPGDPRSRLGAPVSTDPMNDANTWVWPTGRDLYSRARFVNGRQSVRALTTKDGWRMANPEGQDFSNLYLETTFNVGETCHADAPGMADHYGVIVRVPELRHPWQGYLFGFNCNGEYSLRSWNWDGEDERRQEMRMLIDWTKPKTTDNKNLIHAGTQVTNKMGIMTIGSRIRLYANGSFLAEYDYGTNSNIPHLPSGYFGVFVGSRTDSQFTIWVDEMSYWDNPQP